MRKVKQSPEKYLLSFKLELYLLYVKALGSFNAGFPKNVTVGLGGIGSYPIYVIKQIYDCFSLDNSITSMYIVCIKILNQQRYIFTWIKTLAYSIG